MNVDCGLWLIPRGLRVRCPMGPGGSWSVSDRVVFLSVSPPTSGHSTWRATARRPRSPASDHRHVSVLGSKGECSSDGKGIPLRR